MIGKNIIVVGDGHFHLYPCFSLTHAVSALILNLERLADSARKSVPAQNDAEVFRIAFLAEGGQFDCFHQLLGKKNDLKSNVFEVIPGPEEHCLIIIDKDGQKLCLVAGRQIVTGEKLEVLGLGMEGSISAGRPAGEIIEKILGKSGIPVLPFSPGKWFFNRGQLARQLAERYQKYLLIGDSALRPLGWGAPEIMRRAEGKVLPGSDPLPLPGDDKYSGCYGFVYQGSFDTARPLTSIKKIIAATPPAILPAGRRCSFINVAGRLFRLRRNVECSLPELGQGRQNE